MTLDLKNNNIILYDGVCILCNKAVQFVIKRDPNNVFKFGQLQAEHVKKWLTEQGKANTLSTLIYLEKGNVYTHSTAVIKIAAQLTGPIRWISLARFCPQFMRDTIYWMIAQTRYKIFGKDESCLCPSGDIKERLF